MLIILLVGLKFCLGENTLLLTSTRLKTVSIIAYFPFLLSTRVIMRQVIPDIVLWFWFDCGGSGDFFICRREKECQ